MSTIPPVGQRIREVRLHRGITLRGLARAVGVSASLVSQIETGKSQPSVSTLYAITKALDISVEDVFDTDDAPIETDADTDRDTDADAGAGAVPSQRRPRPRTPTSAPNPINAAGAFAAAAAEPVSGHSPDLGPDPGPGPAWDAHERRVGPVVPADKREILELDTGVTWERLGRVPGTPVDFLLVTYAPGGSSSGTGLLMRHSGVEYGYLVSGELTLTLGFDEYKLRPGDSVSFPSTTPHRYSNDGALPAVGVWFVDDSGAGIP